MRRWFLALVATAGMTLAAAPTQAETVRERWGQFWNGVCVDFHRNNAWPEPFQSADRAVTRLPFCIQADNGWKMQNTIGTFMFDENSQLNSAGDLHVKWIVTQAPIHRRAVFVLKGDNADRTAARVASVNEAVAKYAGGAMPPVMVTDTEPSGWSGSYVDAIGQQLHDTIPPPRLPAASSGGGGGGGGSGGGGGTN
ncbi:MAG: hypothetical protein L0211_13225 [Planctomycetaceae bacterium]|nr:hypothetical protein [Planctomycetaceae bacterium]